MHISTFPFSKEGREALASSEPKAKDWPVVYLINNDKELYIGETQNAVYRFEQHLSNEAKKGLKQINVIFDEEYNKSAILDLEQTLIHLCFAERKFKLLNQNKGQSCKHDYYQREKYLNKVDEIWERLRKKGLVGSPISEVRNSNLFKYSPYTSLTMEQEEVCSKVALDASEKLLRKEKGVAIISGGAGTGKTLVLISILFRFLEAMKVSVSPSLEEEERTDYVSLVLMLQDYMKEIGGKKVKIAYVCPMTSLRKTIQKVFSLTGNGLKGSMVKGPQDLFDGDEYDLVLVDEAHRLARRKNITSFGSFDSRARELGLDKEKASQLDFILARSKYTILVYDPAQSVKGSDITPEQFESALRGMDPLRFALKTQMRCKGGEKFISCLDRLFEGRMEGKIAFEEGQYEFKLFEDVGKMVEAIKLNDRIHGLCRVAAGYAWEWVSKPYASKGFDYIVSHNLQDIHIDGHHYVWNMSNKEFILSKNAINEIGCIHTLQGYDLNYVGVILGEEIDYDPEKKEIVIDRERFFDAKVKNGVDAKTLARYIINSYKVMMSRGIKGCYIYCCKKNLREYLRSHMEEVL